MPTATRTEDTARPEDGAETVAALWTVFSDRLRAFISTRVDNRADVDDILMNVFVKIQRSSGSLRDADRLTTWMFRIAHNTIIDHYRSAPRRRETPVDELATADHEPPVDHGYDDQDAVRADIVGCLRPLIEDLPEHYREALELVDLGGVSQTDAARRLGLSVSGMKSRVQRARTQAFERLNDWCSLSLDARGAPVECSPEPGSPCR